MDCEGRREWREVWKAASNERGDGRVYMVMEGVRGDCREELGQRTERWKNLMCGSYVGGGEYKVEGKSRQEKR